jgi:hypothetical protein
MLTIAGGILLAVLVLWAMRWIPYILIILLLAYILGGP